MDIDADNIHTFTVTVGNADIVDCIVMDGTGYDWWVDGTLLEYDWLKDDGTRVPFVSGEVVCWDADRYDAWEQTCFDYDDGKREDMGGYDRDNPPTITVTITADMVREAASKYAAAAGMDKQALMDEQDAPMADCILQIAAYGKEKWA